MQELLAEKRLKLLQIHTPMEDILIFGCRHLSAIWNQQKAFVPQEISTTTCSSSIVDKMRNKN
ncbi:hypothetical protein T07_3193 [Trichinella nelsoni]|uniref:Uncharacterized protein n=1 Tax=Trichinella nelsoni TaxID=6336 RepID=A0A0V0RJH6_9BILA|nr:hypothetical protein T07_3193 [Trichinella nelsoni]